MAKRKPKANAAPPIGDRLLTLREAAEVLRLSTHLLREYVQRDEIQGRIIGGRWRFRRVSRSQKCRTDRTGCMRLRALARRRLRVLRIVHCRRGGRQIGDGGSHVVPSRLLLLAGVPLRRVEGWRSGRCGRQGVGRAVSPRRPIGPLN